MKKRSLLFLAILFVALVGYAQNESSELIATKTSIGPIKMGDNYKTAMETLKKYFPKVTSFFDDMGDYYCITCHNSNGDIALSLQCHSFDDKTKNGEQIESYLITQYAKNIKTKKGFRANMTYGEVIKAGGKWVKTKYEKYVLLDGLCFLFPDNPKSTDIPLQVNNVGAFLL